MDESTSGAGLQKMEVDSFLDRTFGLKGKIDELPVDQQTLVRKGIGFLIEIRQIGEDILAEDASRLMGEDSEGYEEFKSLVESELNSYAGYFSEDRDGWLPSCTQDLINLSTCSPDTRGKRRESTFSNIHELYKKLVDSGNYYSELTRASNLGEEFNDYLNRMRYDELNRIVAVENFKIFDLLPKLKRPPEG